MKVTYSAVFLLLAFGHTSVTEAASFTGLPFNPSAVSADGSVVVGSFGSQAVRWTSGGGVVGLGDLPGGDFRSVPRDVSADGSVIVGSSHLGRLGAMGFRWTSEGGMVGLGDFPGSLASGVSADGSVVVGRLGNREVRWTSGGGMIGLGVIDLGLDIDIIRAFGQNTATAVSADGSVVVGLEVLFSDGGFGSMPWRWTSGDGRVALHDFRDSSVHHIEGYVNVSADGSVVVWQFENEAFRWTSGGGHGRAG